MKAAREYNIAYYKKQKLLRGSLTFVRISKRRGSDGMFGVRKYLDPVYEPGKETMQRKKYY